MLHYVDLLADQPSFHDFGGVQPSVIVVQDPLMLQLWPLHSNMLLQLLQYPTLIHHIDFHFLSNYIPTNRSFTVEKIPPCASSSPISAGTPFFVENRPTSCANFLVSILGRSNTLNFCRRLLHSQGNQ